MENSHKCYLVNKWFLYHLQIQEEKCNENNVHDPNLPIDLKGTKMSVLIHKPETKTSQSASELEQYQTEGYILPLTKLYLSASFLKCPSNNDV